MSVIYRYQLKITEIQKINVPKLTGASSFKDQVLKVDVKNEIPCLWCLVDEDQKKQDVIIRIVGTGHDTPMLTKKSYLGSYMLDNGKFVGHVFILPCRI